MKTETLSIDLIRLDGGSQARIKSSEETIEAYAELIDAGKEWPFGPLDVFHDGSDYFLADGFHRTLAALRLNRASLPCRIHKGTAKDARIFGMTANDKHGLRMSSADKRSCVEWLLDNGPKLTQVEIAAKAGVSIRTVKTVVAERKPQKVQSAPLVSKTLELSPEALADEAEDTEPDDLPEDYTEDGEYVSDVPFDAPEPAETKPEKPPVSRDEQAKLNRTLAQSLIDKAVRAVDDLNAVKRNEPMRAAAVKALQGVKLW